VPYSPQEPPKGESPKGEAEAKGVRRGELLLIQ